jgi:hypothetical protein
MKVYAVTTIKGQTESVCEFSTKKSAVDEITKVWGYKPSKGIKNTFYGCVAGVVGYQNSVTRIYTAKEWETVQYAY